MKLNKEELTVKINISLEELRPFLVADGGDMELVEITDDGIVRVRLLGACSDCSMSLTLSPNLFIVFMESSVEPSSTMINSKFVYV